MFKNSILTFFHALTLHERSRASVVERLHWSDAFFWRVKCGLCRRWESFLGRELFHNNREVINN